MRESMEEDKKNINTKEAKNSQGVRMWTYMATLDFTAYLGINYYWYPTILYTRKYSITSIDNES